jgi:hypothetical protein
VSGLELAPAFAAAESFAPPVNAAVKMRDPAPRSRRCQASAATVRPRSDAKDCCRMPRSALVHPRPKPRRRHEQASFPDLLTCCVLLSVTPSSSPAASRRVASAPRARKTTLSR